MLDAGRSTFLAEHREEIERAAQRVAPYTRWTPLLTTDLDGGLRLKPECFQVTGAFKPRGAFNAVLRLKEASPAPKGVIAVSSGNHAQAVALAARTVGLPAVVLIPHDANPAKVAATRALGAEVIQDGVTFDNREQRLREEMQARGLALVHPFDDWDVIHGQGTASRELLLDDPSVRLLVTPCGGGGLLSGTALVAKAHEPRVAVIGVEPERADDAARSLRSGRIERLPAAPETIADGVRPVAIGQRTFEVIVTRGLVDDIVTVSEEEIAEATRVAWLRLKLALEPTGALPLAAHLAGKLPRAGGPIGLILSGGNPDPSLVATLLRSA